MTSLHFEEIGAKIRQVRGTLSQKTFGESVAASRGYVNNIEHGAKPSIEFLAKVCVTYGVSLDWLILGKCTPFPSNDETAPDGELAEMLAVLTGLLNSADSDLQGWTRIQFKKTFGEYDSAARKRNTQNI
ncbi:MAG: helix-turn-helix transcriptional regulator [Veillonellales bacterium]